MLQWSEKHVLMLQVAPAAVIGVPSRPTYQPQLVHAPSSAAADAPLHFQCPALQVNI